MRAIASILMLLLMVQAALGSVKLHNGKKGKGDKKKKKGKKAAPFVPPPVDGDLAAWLGPWWKKRDALMPQFRDAITNFRPVQIRNFLNPDYALALHG